MQIAVVGIDLGKNRLNDGEPSCCADPCATGSYQACGKAEAVGRGHAGVLRGASSWPRPAGSGP
jgi:hypothetical protein